MEKSKQGAKKRRKEHFSAKREIHNVRKEGENNHARLLTQKKRFFRGSRSEREARPKRNTPRIEQRKRSCPSRLSEKRKRNILKIVCKKNPPYLINGSKLTHKPHRRKTSTFKSNLPPLQIKKKGIPQRQESMPNHSQKKEGVLGVIAGEKRTVQANTYRKNRAPRGKSKKTFRKKGTAQSTSAKSSRSKGNLTFPSCTIRNFAKKGQRTLLEGGGVPVPTICSEKISLFPLRDRGERRRKKRKKRVTPTLSHHPRKSKPSRTHAEREGRKILSVLLVF